MNVTAKKEERHKRSRMECCIDTVMNAVEQQQEDERRIEIVHRVQEVTG